ncbi:MAG: hypothetical protein OXU66_03685 [Gammaproteobacteria bacterium]|nr:hypothetical protein [Gammaproteobacteria bacterium]MDD9896302.1 hypothetical protein [Gammaproteobacteria bacterium]MDD9958020.1 hypothetical protein [Gammaproteobacteria bacterium]
MTKCFATNPAPSRQITFRSLLDFNALFFSCFVFSFPVIAAEDQLSLVASSNEQNQQIEMFRTEIEELESEYGPLDQSLIEPLSGLSDLYTDIGNLQEANRLLDRQLQLTHVAEGPETFSQIPIIEKMIANNVRMNDLESANNNFDNIRFVYTRNPASTTQQKLQAMDELRHWYFTAFNLDEKRNRINYFRLSRELLDDMMTIAEDEFGEESPEMIPYLYKSALEKYHLLTLLFSHDELGEDAYDDIFEPEQVQPEAYLRQGYDIVQDIREIVQQSNNIEADAMAAVYEGDYRMLLGMGLAQRSYREAMELFAEAGKSEQEIADFFSRPIVLPVTEYFFTMEEAIAAQDAAGYRFTRGTEDEDPMVHLGNFIAWNESLLNAAKPAPPAILADLEEELHRVDIRFTIYSRGETRTPDVESSEPDTRQPKVDGSDAVEMMIFRPRFRGNRWRTLRNATISYWYPPEK